MKKLISHWELDFLAQCEKDNVFDMQEEPERIDYGVRWEQSDLADLFVVM